MNRIPKCHSIMKDLGADALLLCDEANMHYLCGFSPSEGMVLIFADAAYHLVDSRYTETATAHAKNLQTGLQVLEVNGSFYVQMAALMKKHKAKNLLYESETISHKRYEALCKQFHFLDEHMIPLGDRLMRERNRKDADEIVLMKKANAIAEKSFLELLNSVKVGKTEKELAAEFDYLMAKNGSHGLSFDTILLTGAHTSMPHGVPGDSVIKEGDFVLFDFGATYEGYHSDMTRTVAVGHATDKMQQMYQLVLDAQLAGIRAFNAGVRCADVYDAAWNVLEREHMAKYFRHGLGHGVGLEIHEGFSASPHSEDVYEVGNVSSIEPGIYLPDQFGIRIEDVCYLSPRGRENLSTVTKELIIL